MSRAKWRLIDRYDKFPLTNGDIGKFGAFNLCQIVERHIQSLASFRASSPVIRRLLPLSILLMRSTLILLSRRRSVTSGSRNSRHTFTESHQSRCAGTDRPEVSLRFSAELLKRVRVLIDQQPLSPPQELTARGGRFPYVDVAPLWHAAPLPASGILHHHHEADDLRR